MRYLAILFHLIVVSLALPGYSVSQSQKDRSGLDFFGESETKTPQTITNVPIMGVALESTIDPEKYYVGPSDVFSVNIWLSPPLSFSLTATPEGTLIIPTVGEVSLAGLTLAEAKNKVLKDIRKKYLRGEATVTLIFPRSIVVTVTGNVLNPGLYTVSAVDRAEKAMEDANKPTRTQNQNDAARILYDMSTRNVVLKHKDGSVSRVDVAKFLATKEDKWNPYLREGDVIIVPRKNLIKNVFGVYGEVNTPGRFEFVRGDSVKDALNLAQGFTRLALTDSIEFSRLGVTGDTTFSSVINAKELFSGKIPDFPLEPGDRIVVRAKPDLREDYIATIVGEVLYPGTYPITKNRTRLSEVVRKAGGFTDYASLKSTELNRRSVEPQDVDLERLLSFRGGVSPEDSAYYYLETNVRIRKEIVNVDFVKLFREKDSTQDVILQSGDYIVVPSIRKTIYVFGQVVLPGHVPFVPGESERYYIAKTGGFTERARTGDLKIVKAKTKQWLSPRETTIEEGDYIWVPKEPDRTFAYYMTIMSQAASVLSVVVGIAVVVVQVTK